MLLRQRPGAWAGAGAWAGGRRGGGRDLAVGGLDLHDSLGVQVGRPAVYHHLPAGKKKNLGMSKVGVGQTTPKISSPYSCRRRMHERGGVTHHETAKGIPGAGCATAMVSKYKSREANLEIADREIS